MQMRLCMEPPGQAGQCEQASAALQSARGPSAAGRATRSAIQRREKKENGVRKEGKLLKKEGKLPRAFSDVLRASGHAGLLARTHAARSNGEACQGPRSSQEHSMSRDACENVLLAQPCSISMAMQEGMVAFSAERSRSLGARQPPPCIVGTLCRPWPRSLQLPRSRRRLRSCRRRRPRSRWRRLPSGRGRRRSRRRQLLRSAPRARARSASTPGSS